MAVTTPEREAGTWSGAVFTIARASFCGDWTDSRDVPKAAETVVAVPRTGKKSLPESGVPTVSPSARRPSDTCATSVVLGPNSAAYCAASR